MATLRQIWAGAWLALAMMVAAAPAIANSLREKGKPALVADAIKVTPPRDWNRLTLAPGKHAETWTLDGDQLDEVTFYGGVGPGETLIREVNRKAKPLPKVTAAILLVEVPELLEATYRSAKAIASFDVTGSSPRPFLGQPGIFFTYQYVDEDNLTRKGEARATLVKGKLYMATFAAPRLNYFDRCLADVDALLDSATLA